LPLPQLSMHRQTTTRNSYMSNHLTRTP
jgi:hypothetical protein